MIETIKYHPQFDKQCQKLAKANGKARKAVENALTILRAFKRSGKGFKHIGSLTHRGELRLKNAIKYRLGNGYRLVLLIKNNSLFVLCIGSHDQCDKWLEKNRGQERFSFSNLEKVSLTPEIEKTSQHPVIIDEKPGLATQIDDRVLRQVFHGICNAT